MSNNTKLLCLFLRAQKINKSSEQGYAMAMVSMVSIIMLSLLAASITFSNLAKSRTDAFVDSSSAFSVAEAGLNKRAVEFRDRIETYSGVKDVSALTGSQTLADCFGEGASSATPTGTDYLGCRNYSFKSRNNASTTVAANGDIALNNFKENEAVNEYMAYTAISQTPPQLVSISDGDYAGLNALEYKYVLSSTAKKPVNSETTTAGNTAKSSNNINLSMTFTNRVVSLFQFAIFYDGDLEFNSTSPMDVKGWVHSNANIYVQPAGETTVPTTMGSNAAVTTFSTKVSAVGSIYNRIDAWNEGRIGTVARVGITRVLLTGDSCPSTGTLTSTNDCKYISAYAEATTTPLDADEIATFNKKILAGTTLLKAPPAGFFRKRRYLANASGKYQVGESFAKADMRLDFVPKRDTTTDIIPFNFTAIRTTGNTCSTTAPTTETDPTWDYVDPKREGLSTARCNQLSKGQLQSLRQPVLVLTNLNQTTGLATPEDTALKRVRPTTETMTALRSRLLSSLNNTEANRNKILRALQVALVSTPKPISLDRLNDLAFNNPSYLTSTDPSYDPNLNAFRAEFSRQLDAILPASATATDAQSVANRDDKRTLLTTAKPSEIAALQDAWFLPAPIQRIITNTPTADNTLSSGFYDGREQRWISVLQTNIASLAVWNRDGLYVTASNETMTSAYAASDANRDSAFKNANTKDLVITNARGTTSELIVNTTTTNATAATTTQYFTSGLAFDRATTIPSTMTPKGLQELGLGSIDSTEGGLIIHASVNDDLDGNTTTTGATNDITKDTADDSKVWETNIVAGARTRTHVDYLRKYPGITGTKKSPYAFAFTGGDYLPNNLMLVSDQAVYVQGNFNNNNNTNIGGSPRPIAPSGENESSTARLSASIIGDTITVLSNECMSLTTVSASGVPAGQLNCGVSSGNNLVGQPMVINAAFLSNTDASNGNLGTDRGYVSGNTTNNRYSGGVNNYIRLLEDWNNGGTGSPYALNYTGSMISLGVPLEYSGRYRPGGLEASGSGSTAVLASYYNIPLRNFSFDSNFNRVEQLPPLTPKVSYVEQKNFSRTY
jgi:Tfp pilus assembly protein PilX